jgi:superfamily II DNA or RNA helicase
MITVCKHDPLNIQINTDNIQYLRDVRDYFSDYVEGFMHMPAFKNSGWDGKVSMMNVSKRTLPYGLLIDFIRFHKKEHPELELKIEEDALSFFRGPDYHTTYNLKYVPHYYQDDCIKAGLHYRRGIIRSATASGKSLIISYIIKTLFENKVCKKALIIVPTISLVEQFYSDMIEYGYFKDKMLGRVYEKYKEFDKRVVISTWQTLSKNHMFLPEFDIVICDETHGAKAYEVKKILEKTTLASYRLGFTGTLPDPKVDNWNVKSYLGPVIREYGAGQLGEEGFISKANIIVIDIKYQNEYKGTYDEVKEQIFKNPFRLNVMREITNYVKGNVLFLVGMVEREGAMLKEYLEKNSEEKEIVFLHGASKVEEREYWRKECEVRNNVVLIATYGIFQQGINIPSLKYIVLASPYKSKIRVLQSIGRGLRTHENKKDGAYIFDIFDDCKYLYDHGIKRERHYHKEGFDVRDIVVQEGDDLSGMFMI